MKKITFLFLLLWLSAGAQAQTKPPTEYGSGLKVSLNEDGSKYFRLIAWTQFQLNFAETTAVSGNDVITATPSLRRSRLLMFAQLNDRFLILTHFGLNNLFPAGLHPTGQSSQAQLFMHDAWVEYKVLDQLYLGGGLHYWNGISRATNQSTLNMLALDNPRHAWATIGTSDQFARHLGIYAKGKLGKLDYRLAWNAASVNSLDINNGQNPTANQAAYTGRSTFGVESSNIFAGYLNYQFLDQESNKLPYFVGTYFGTKKVFNLGAGFFTHPNGSVILDNSGQNLGQNVLLWAVDAFTELPFGTKNAAFTGYASWQNNDFGTNYQLDGDRQDIFTGNVLYGQAGVLLPHSGKAAWQPYATVTAKTIENGSNSATDLGLGMNYLINGHHAKLSLEYRNGQDALTGDRGGNVIFQAVVFL
jgi:hypothetical protein